jgi:hypothetical protein
VAERIYFHRQISLRKAPLWRVLSLALAMSGCGPSAADRGPTGTVSGRVVVEGTIPAGSKIVFEHREKGAAVEVPLQQSGEYRLGDVLVGRNIVTVVTVPPPLPDDANAAPPAAATHLSLPAKYAASDTSGLTADVVAGPNSFDFDLRESGTGE